MRNQKLVLLEVSGGHDDRSGWTPVAQRLEVKVTPQDLLPWVYSRFLGWRLTKLARDL
jgi:hypothetical protein